MYMKHLYIISGTLSAYVDYYYFKSNFGLAWFCANIAIFMSTEDGLKYLWNKTLCGGDTNLIKTAEWEMKKNNPL